MVLVVPYLVRMGRMKKPNVSRFGNTSMGVVRMWTDIACSSTALWWYGEFETFFTLAFLLLAIYAVREIWR